LVVVALACAALAWACSGPPERAAAPAEPPTTPAPAPKTAVLVDMPADVQPIFAKKCADCHGLDARGGPAAPNLRELDVKHTPDEWIAYLKDPRSRKKLMPRIVATPDEYKILGEWLAEVTSKDGKAASEEPARKAGGRQT
jgi:mono/diheme cytochrome c family protein